MTKIIVISNEKGGCGKTTITLSLAFKAEIRKEKTLLIDMDGQCNLSSMFNVDSNNGNIMNLLEEEKSFTDCIFKVNDYLEIIPGNHKISQLDKILDTVGKEARLKESLDEYKNNYDYILIDTPPSLNLAVLNAYVACDYVIIPIKAGDLFSLSSIPQVIKLIESIKKYYNPNIKKYYFAINEYSTRSNLDIEVVNMLNGISNKLDSSIFENKILSSVAIERNKFVKKNIFLNSDKKNKAVLSLDAFTNEVFKKLKT